MLTDNKEFNKEPIDIDLSVTERQSFRINGDNNRRLELNVSDMGIINRLNETYPKLRKMAQDAVSLKSDAIVAEDDDTLSESAIAKIGEQIKSLDAQMREAMDYVFDSNVSEMCAPDGTMFDLFKGDFRYEHILNTLSKLYEKNIQSEYDLVKRKMEAHTKKYTTKSKSKKK